MIGTIIRIDLSRAGNEKPCVEGFNPSTHGIYEKS